MRYEIHFTLVVDECPTLKDVEDHVRVAVECWGGGGDPDDWTYGIHGAVQHVVVKRLEVEI